MLAIVGINIQPSTRSSALVMVVALLIPSAELRASDPDIHDVVAQWAAAAESIESFEVQIVGKDLRPAADLRSARIPVDSRLQEVPLDFQIDYLFSRPDKERYSRRGTMPSSKGLEQLRRQRVLTGNHARVLDEGGPDTHFQYDQFTLEERKPIREPALQPIRNLLNISGSGKDKFLVGHRFEIIEDSEQEIDGLSCLLAESVAKRGARIWFEHSKPYLIRKMELEHVVAERSGHLEYWFKYDGQVVENSAPPSFIFPTGWEITIFAPDRKVRSRVVCNVVSVKSNFEIPDSEFELAVPAGALIADNRQKQSAYFLQLADGTTRPIPVTELGPKQLFKLSASVPGSRIENQKLPGEPTSTAANAFWWLVANAVLVALLAGFYFWKRKSV